MKIRMQQPVKVVVEHDLAKSIMEILKLEDKWRVMIVLDQFLMGVPAVQEMIAEIQKITLKWKSTAISCQTRLPASSIKARKQ